MCVVALFAPHWALPEQEQSGRSSRGPAQSPKAAPGARAGPFSGDGMSAGISSGSRRLTAKLLVIRGGKCRMATMQWRSQHPLTDDGQLFTRKLWRVLHSPPGWNVQWRPKRSLSIYTGQSATLEAIAIKAS